MVSFEFSKSYEIFRNRINLISLGVKSLFSHDQSFSFTRGQSPLRYQPVDRGYDKLRFNWNFNRKQVSTILTTHSTGISWWILFVIRFISKIEGYHRSVFLLDKKIE